jgi:putative serine protease PepD
MTEVDNGGQMSVPVPTGPWAARDKPSHRATSSDAKSHGMRCTKGLLSAIAAVVVSFVIGVSAYLIVHPLSIGSRNLLPSNAVPKASAEQPLSSVEQVAAKVVPSVVMLETDLGGGEFDEGSGIVLTADGLVMTNQHVVAAAVNASSLPVRTTVRLSDGSRAPFRVFAVDPKTDIAVVRVEGVTGLAPMTFGSSADLRVGQPIVAVGAPLGLNDTVTTGVVSALDRPVYARAQSDNQLAAYDAIQTDAALNPGSSGGALVDMRGRLVGVTSATAALASLGGSEGLPGGSIGIGYAIPVDQAQRIARELIATGTASHAWLGAQVSSGPSTDGATVIGVAAGGPAATAGLPSGAVVTNVDGQVIENAEALKAAVQSTAPGVSATLAVIDPSGDHRTIHISLGTDQGLPRSPIEADEGIDV